MAMAVVGLWLMQHAFAILACLPGFIGLFRSLWEKRNFDKATKEIETAATQSKTMTPSGRHASPGFEKDVSDQRPSWWLRVFSVVCLTAVFAVVAAVGGDANRATDLGAGRVNQAKAEKPPSGSTTSAGAAAPGSPAATTGTSGQGAPGAPAKKTVVGLAGLVYAGYGAYVYTMLLIISRLNSKALTSMFFMVSAVRSAIALVLGFAVADTNVFAGLSDNQGLFVLFFVGLFPAMAMDALRQRAQQLFKPATPGCDGLPLCLIDGIDDGIADRLAETGIWDIEHVATADAYKLTAQTLYPLRRIIDWMDQALLISYVRTDVVHFRACGLRGAIDLAATYSDAMGLRVDVDRQPYLDRLTDRAQKLIQALAQKTSLPEPTIYMIGRNLYEDAVVNYIWNLWFDDGNGNGNGSGHGAGAAGGGGEQQQPSPAPGGASTGEAVPATSVP